MQAGWVRIIAGKWRGRRLKVPEVKDLRPTPDRVRETLFNWLAPLLPGAYCLDMFAGSGVLGFEALSRGCAHVVMVDESAKIIALLKEELETFQAENADIYCAKVPGQLKPPAQPFDIVFLDPPYKEDLLLPSLAFLTAHGYLADMAHIYLEADRAIEDNELPAGIRIIKQQKAGQVFYHLALREIS